VQSGQMAFPAWPGPSAGPVVPTGKNSSGSTSRQRARWRKSIDILAFSGYAPGEGHMIEGFVKVNVLCVSLSMQSGGSVGQGEKEWKNPIRDWARESALNASPWSLHHCPGCLVRFVPTHLITKPHHAVYQA